MENEYQVPNVENGVSFEERFAALEHQSYLMYLQLNAVTQLLVDSGVLEKEKIGKQMDGMHNEIIKAVEELQSAYEEDQETKEANDTPSVVEG
jgi:hypothetical protein